MTEKVFQASAESKAQAKQLRLFALLAWFVAMAGQVFAILKLIHDETLVWLVVAIVVILILTIVGSWLWKKANRLDPASEQDKVKFFIQNQLGAILGVLAFLPMVIFIFTNKNASGKTKGIAGAAAVIAMLVAGITGVDFNPPSIEKYTKEINEQTDVLKKINLNNDLVYWTREGNKYHIYEDCQHIKGRDGISSGTVKESFEKKGLSELCKTCQKRAIKQNDVSENILSEKALDTAGSE
ncbi:hypothetical protein [Pedobacter sp.]